MFIVLFLFVIACAFSSLFDDWRRSCEYVLLFFRLTVNNLYEKNEKYQARNTCRMYVRVMGVRETQCEYCDAAGSVEPGAVCWRTFEKALEDAGYSSVMLSDTAGIDKDEVCIRLEQATDTAGLKKEGFTILPVET